MEVISAIYVTFKSLYVVIHGECQYIVSDVSDISKDMYFIAYRDLMSIVGKNQIRERVAPRLRTIHTAKGLELGTVAWQKAYMRKDYCSSSIGYACERPSAGGSGVEGRGIANL